MLTLEDLQGRHAECAAARQQLQKDYQQRDLGFAYVLGELEQLIALVEAREAAALAETQSP